jgi:hypothetical protein
VLSYDLQQHMDVSGVPAHVGASVSSSSSSNSSSSSLRWAVTCSSTRLPS